MSSELVNTFATLGTFVVIAATAIAAIVQLRHMRGSNQIVALNELREARASEFQEALQFVAELPVIMRDPAFRYQLANRPAATGENGPLITKIGRVGNYYEAVGILVKTGLVEKSLVLDFWWATRNRLGTSRSGCGNFASSRRAGRVGKLRVLGRLGASLGRCAP